MSIVSSICADFSNKVKEKWQQKHLEAIQKKDWKLVTELYEEMKKYYFSE